MVITLGSPTGIAVRLNGVEVYSNSTNFGSFHYNTSLCYFGRKWNNDALFFVGRIANVMTFNQRLGSSDIANIESYLSNQYQISIGSSPAIASYNPYTENSGLLTVHGLVDASDIETNTLSVSGAASVGSALSVGGDVSLPGKSVYCEMLDTSVLQTHGIYYESAIECGRDSSSNYYYAQYQYGGLFYVDGSYNPTSNFYLSIYNIPVDTGAAYTLSLMYQQPSTCYYCNKLRCQDASGSWVLGDANSWVTPRFSGGTPSFSTSPNVVVQQFSVLSIPDNTSTMQRYCVSSVSPFS
jgi:hypothetical protein